jgi:hypothetical protein
LTWDVFGSKLQDKRELARPRRMCVWKSNFEMVQKEIGSEGVDWQNEYKGRTLFSAIIQLKFP